MQSCLQMMMREGILSPVRIKPFLEKCNYRLEKPGKATAGNGAALIFNNSLAQSAHIFQTTLAFSCQGPCLTVFLLEDFCRGLKALCADGDLRRTGNLRVMENGPALYLKERDACTEQYCPSFPPAAGIRGMLTARGVF